MKTVFVLLLCLSSTIALCISTAVAQDKGVVTAASMGYTRGLSSPLIRATNGAMFIAVAGDNNSYELKSIPQKWVMQSVSSAQGHIPFDNYLPTAITVSGDKVWVGSNDEIAYQNDNGWTMVATTQSGRRTQVHHLTAYEEARGVFACINSTADVSTTAGASIQPNTSIELITANDRRELYRDTTAQNAFSNGAKLSDGSYLFASRNGNERCLVRVRPEGNVRLIPAPAGMPLTAQPALVLKGYGSKYYCIYQASSERSATQPSFVVSYDESSEQTEYIPLGDMGWRITGAMMSGKVLLISADNGVISLNDKKASKYRFFGNVEGITNDVEALGITKLNRGTALITTQLGLILLPLSVFEGAVVANDYVDMTSVSTKFGLLNFESLVPSAQIDWQVFDNNGRMVAQGKSSADEIPNGFNLPALANGTYNVVMTSAGNAVYVQRIIITK